MANDTIVALATAPGESAVAITRLSGPDALSLAARHFRGRVSPRSSAGHQVLLGTFLGADGAPLDRVLLLVFRAPRSYTGEDMVEISSHGGSVIPRMILDTLVAAGARPARPGEFTERAYRNGKLDLSQAESVAALVRARSERAMRAAGSALGGSLARGVQAVDEDLVALLSEVESRIDFPADVGDELDGPALAGRCGAVAARLREWAARAPESRRLQEGVRVVLVGKPNAGKSSLLNALVGYERAIVTEMPGTTRDTVEGSIVIDGFELRVIDTAGIREVSDPVEGLGVARAEREARDCDLAVLVLDRSRPIAPADHEAAALVRGRPVVVAWNKADLPRAGNGVGCVGEERIGGDDAGQGEPLGAFAEVETVAVRPGGAEPLREALRRALPRVIGAHAGEEIATTSARQEALLEEALAAVERAEAGLRADHSYDLVASDLADARRALGEVVGRGVDDRVVAAIFSRFCIGK